MLEIPKSAEVSEKLRKILLFTEISSFNKKIKDHLSKYMENLQILVP